MCAKAQHDASIGQRSSNKSQQTSGGAQDLQKAPQNPVSSLISVPVQNNSNFGIGPFNRTQNVLNIQLVIPVELNEKISLIIRWTTPIAWQPAPGPQAWNQSESKENTPTFLLAESAQKTAGVFGFGDMTPRLFLSPTKPGKLIWEAGLAFFLPTATSRFLGAGKSQHWPFVALIQPAHRTIGVLVNNVWSVAGPSDRTDVNQMTLQYFINYNLKKGWFVSVSPIITTNWKAMSQDIWTVSVGGGIGRIFKLASFLFPKLPPEMKENLKQLEQKKS